MKKPHLGRIANWRRFPYERGLGYLLIGHFVDHPEFAGLDGSTSYVVKAEAAADGTIEIETHNSRYTLEKP